MTKVFVEQSDKTVLKKRKSGRHEDQIFFGGCIKTRYGSLGGCRPLPANFAKSYCKLIFASEDLDSMNK